MTTQPTPQPISAATRFLVAILAAAPFALLQLVFLSDSLQWAAFLFGYMGIVLAAPVVFVGWAVYCFAEYRLRRAKLGIAFPSFSIVGGLFLLAFFLPAIALNPILSKFPQFCRVTQSIEWSTSKPHSVRNTKHSFVLVLVGTGTISNHHFTTGYMNWTGNEPAGFSSVDFNPVSFQERYNEPNQSGSRDYLVSRMSNSAIPEDELTAITNDLWGVLGRVNNGLAVDSTTGVVDDVYCHVDNQWDYLIGGWVWVFLLLGSFVVMGMRTMVMPNTGQAAV